MAFAYQGRSVSPASASRPAAIARVASSAADRRRLVGQHRRERRDREQLGRRQPLRRRALADGVAAAGHPGAVATSMIPTPTVTASSRVARLARWSTSDAARSSTPTAAATGAPGRARAPAPSRPRFGRGRRRRVQRRLQMARPCRPVPRWPRPCRARAAGPEARWGTAAQPTPGAGTPPRTRGAAARGGASRLHQPLHHPLVDAGSENSRCSATRSLAPGARASSRAASRWPRLRCPLESSA